MTEKKKDLLLTDRKKMVLLMILEILEEQKGSQEPYRIRKLHNKLTARAKTMEKPASNCLIGDTLKELVDAEILTVIEKGVTEKDLQDGKRMESVLYDWNPAVFAGYEIKVVRSKPPKERKKGEKISTPVIVKESPEEYYTALCREIVDLEREHEERGRILAGKRAEKAAVDESIANVQRFFQQGGAK